MKTKRGICLLLALVLLLVLAACASREPEPETTPEPEETPAPTATPVPERMLVVYFSPETEAADTGETTKGETAVLAELLAEKLGADLWEIVPARGAYPTDREELRKTAETEQASKARPAIGGTLPELEAYDTVLLGAPVWNGDWAMILYSFLEGTDLAGKKLVPFGVYEGEAPAGLEKKIAVACPYSTVTPGLLLRPEDMTGKPLVLENSVRRWLLGLNYTA